MKKFKLLTDVEKLSMTDEEIKGSIILQCADDGVSYPQEPELKTLKEVPASCPGKTMFKPVIKFDRFYSDRTLPLFFESAEKAINFVKTSGAKFAQNEDSCIIQNDNIEISAKGFETYASEVEKNSQERSIAKEENEKIKDYNSELSSKYKEEQKAFEEASADYFEEYYQLIRERNNLKLLNREYLQYLELCDNNEDIAKKVFCNARPSANFDAVKNFKLIEPKQTPSPEKKSSK